MCFPGYEVQQNMQSEIYLYLNTFYSNVFNLQVMGEMIPRVTVHNIVAIH